MGYSYYWIYRLIKPNFWSFYLSLKRRTPVLKTQDALKSKCVLRTRVATRPAYCTTGARPFRGKMINEKSSTTSILTRMRFIKQYEWRDVYIVTYQLSNSQSDMHVLVLLGICRRHSFQVIIVATTIPLLSSQFYSARIRNSSACIPGISLF